MMGKLVCAQPRKWSSIAYGMESRGCSMTSKGPLNIIGGTVGRWGSRIMKPNIYNY